MKIFSVIEIQPEFEGGSKALFQFLMDNVIYPKDALLEGVEGRVVVSFTVDIDGSITEVSIRERDLYKFENSFNIFKGFKKRIQVDSYQSIDRESLRVVQSMPKWKPGMQNDKFVRVAYTIPIIFRIG
jgi:periplasmic protein TonB